MSLAAARGATNATVQLPLGQLALVGLGAFVVGNPDKFFETLTRGLQFISTASAALSDGHNGAGSGKANLQQPIIIHQALASNSTYRGYVIQLLLSAGLCWGTYVVLVQILPEQAKGMLPVTTSRFNRSISSLGKAVINLKDTVMEQINVLSGKQDEFKEQQEHTHTEVLNVRDNVEDVRGDLSIVTESLELCHNSLAESERRITYIARGVQLLTRGVSTFLPENDNLLHELLQFNTAGDEYHRQSPVEQQRIQQSLRAIQEGARNHHMTLRNDSDENSADPENEVPSTPTRASSSRSNQQTTNDFSDVHAIIAESTLGAASSAFRMPWSTNRTVSAKSSQ